MTRRLLPLLSLLPLLLVTMGAGPCDSEPLGSVGSCSYKGKTYAHGAKVPVDTCNTCTCVKDQQLECTLLACTSDGGAPDASATDGGRDASQVCFGDDGSLVACCFDSKGNLGPCPVCFDNNGKVVPCPTSDGGGSMCYYAGKPYPVGATFPSSDGCNSCSCQADVSVACTERACFDAGVGFDAGVDVPTYCEYGGTRYVAGSTFPSTDGCNTCSCDAIGVACTKKACVPDASTGDGGVVSGVCQLGADQTCNEDPVASALRGKCQPGGSCTCGGSGSSGVASPYTGKCLGPGNTTGEGCEYGGKVQPVGASFTCADGCSVCTCKASGYVATLSTGCGDAGTGSMCGLDAIYIYGAEGGLVAYRDQVTLAPSTSSPATAATYTYTRTNRGSSSGVSCAPAFPSCGDPAAVDVSDIMADLLDPLVQKYLSVKTSPPMFFGVDQRPNDGAAFSLQRGDGHGFLVGGPCNGASGCSEIPPAITKLVGDLTALDRQQLATPSCADALAPATFACGSTVCKTKAEYCARASTGGVEKLAGCRSYPSGCTTCDCARKDATSILQSVPACAQATSTCSDSVGTVAGSASTPSLVVWCQIP